jgi:hypothetical protein
MTVDTAISRTLSVLWIVVLLVLLAGRFGIGPGLWR